MIASNQPSPPRIVVVDDDLAVRSALQFSLELSGFAVAGYASGEALMRQADLPSGDCLVLDYQLPGMDGLQLLRTLRERCVTAPAILITTNPNRKLRAQALAAGVTIVEKPLLTEALEDTVRQALAGAPEARPG